MLFFKVGDIITPIEDKCFHNFLIENLGKKFIVVSARLIGTLQFINVKVLGDKEVRTHGAFCSFRFKKVSIEEVLSSDEEELSKL